MTSSNFYIFHVTGPLCGEFTGPGEFPRQRPVTRSFDVFFDLCPNKRLSKQPRGWWFETPSRSLWRHCNVEVSLLAHYGTSWLTLVCSPACRTSLIATRFWVVMICPIIKCLTVLRVFFYFVWFVFIHHNFQFYFELCTYCNILDIYLSQNLNFVNYLLFFMKLLNYLSFNMFGSVLECCELTGVRLL